MLTKLTMFFCCTFVAVLCVAQKIKNGPVYVPASEVAKNQTLSVPPTYPALAKAARVQGSVRLAVVVGKTGNVESVSVASGHPMLIPAAVEAVKKWQYKRFLIDGQPASVKTEIEVPFSLGISEADYTKEQDASDAYFKQEDQCRWLLNAKQYDEAESSCRTGAELAQKLPPERQNERRIAYQLLGHSLFSQKKFKDALSSYQEELTIAKASLQPYEAELGYSYHDVALSLYATGDIQQSRSAYESAMSTLERARDHIESPFLKNEYSRTIKTVLQEYAFLLRKSGDSAGAEAAEKRAASIIVRTDMKDQ
jgi:TonB family protein